MTPSLGSAARLLLEHADGNDVPAWLEESLGGVRAALLPREPYVEPMDSQAAREVAALFVQPGGCYSRMPGVDPWPESRDARTYAGPHPVVAHPPCATWGRYAHKAGGKGNDDGCFASALASVRRWGGHTRTPVDLRRVAGVRPPPPGRSAGRLGRLVPACFAALVGA